MQRQLAPEQLSTFYTDVSTRDQVHNFVALMPPQAGPVVVDVGGGQGFFARALRERTGATVRVLDSDPVSIAGCVSNNVPGVLGDALHPPVQGDEGVACFNLILHHLIGATEAQTRALQTQALAAWRGKAAFVFVTEYVYDGPLNLPGRLIYWITRSRLLSALAALPARYLPRLAANTFGVGVRFRGRGEWVRLFEEAGFTVLRYAAGRREGVALPRRLLLIAQTRRDTFVLVRR